MVMIAFEFGTPEARKIEIAKQLLNEREEIGFYGIIESLPDPTGIRKDWEQRRLTVDKNDRNRRFSFFSHSVSRNWRFTQFCEVALQSG